MKFIKYKTVTYINRGTEDTPILEERLMDTVRTYSKADVEVASSEAYNGEYEIIDDGEPEPPPTTEQRVSDLEEQIAQADETAISLYEAQEAQEVINAQQDEALMEIYEMIG